MFEFVVIVIFEYGKVFLDVVGEVLCGIENVEFVVGFVYLFKGECSEQVFCGVDVYFVKQLVGVVVVIILFNFFVMVFLWMVVLVIVCGNMVVFKLSEKDFLVVSWFVKLFQEVGLFDGVFNVVNGDKEVVDMIIDFFRVDVVSFVGFILIVCLIYQCVLVVGKCVQVFGGVKNYMVVMFDVDIDVVVDVVVFVVYGFVGECCMVVLVLVVVGDVVDDFVVVIVDCIDGFMIGVGMDVVSEMGLFIICEYCDKVVFYVMGVEVEGVKVVVDGMQKQFDLEGFFLGVSLIDQVVLGMRVYDDEIFGLVLLVVCVDIYVDVVVFVNVNVYGNGIVIFMCDGGMVCQYEFDIEVGMVGVNVLIFVLIGVYFFGGWKDLLFGDFYIYGFEFVYFYMCFKVVIIWWLDYIFFQIDFGFLSNY